MTTQAGNRNDFGSDRPGGWYVELATGRVVRKPAAVVPPARRRAYWMTREPEAKRMSTDKDAGSSLNPIEDIKGAVKFVKNLHPIEEVKEFMETAAKVLEPSESDLRVVEWEEPEVKESAEPTEAERARQMERRPGEGPHYTDAKELHL